MRSLPPPSTTLVALLMAGGAACVDAADNKKKGTRPKSSLIRKSDLPDSDGWMSLQPDVEFLPGSAVAKTDGAGAGAGPSSAADNDRMEEAVRRQLGSSGSDFTPYSSQPYVQGESEYDEYQQAWRYLGFMIDCDATAYDDDGSWDGGTGEGCSRYLMWAAYVDLGYEGGGIGEYQFWDIETEEWDDTSCNYGGGGNRCAKMDCHEEDTHWSLLGLFKHRSYDDWMEQLFKHEGYCVWSGEEYNYMSSMRGAWPQGCSETAASDGSVIYYDLKPTGNGNMDIGLYTDTRCMKSYKGDDTVEDVLGNILVDGGSGDGSGDNEEYEDTSGYSLDESMAKWETTMDTWKICHPCVAYDLNNVGYNVDDDESRGSTYNTYTYGYDDDNYNGDQSDFDCYDDADYTNVNQCMKFMAKTAMNTATFRDLSLASSQGSLVESIPVAGIDSRNKKNTKTLKGGVTLFFLIASSTVCAAGVYMYYKTQKEIKEMPQFIREPLVFA